MKKCSRCGETDLSKFGRDSVTPSGLRQWCKACENAKKKAYRARMKAKNGAAPQPVDPLADLQITVDPSDDVTKPEAHPLPKTPLETAYEKRAEERAKRDLKKEHSALIDENIRLKAEMQELVKMQAPADILVYQKPSWERADAIPMVVISDIHADEVVRKEAVHGLNEYSPEIARERVMNLFVNAARLTEIAARDSIITSIYLAFLGDNFSGWIHDELKYATAMAPGDAANFVMGLFIAGIDYLLKETSLVITGDMIPGNHGRMTDKMSFADPTGTSLETMMYHAIVGRYENEPRVQLRVASQAMIYRTLHERFVMRLIHGYETKYLGGIGGLTIPLNKAIAAWDSVKHASLTVLGHYHTFFDGPGFLVNGSAIGYNTYAQQAVKARFEEPQQAFALIHARNGGTKSIVAPIWLDKSKESNPPPPSSHEPSSNPVVSDVVR